MQASRAQVATGSGLAPEATAYRGNPSSMLIIELTHSGSKFISFKSSNVVGFTFGLTAQ